MENLLLKKLQIKPGFKVKVIHPPANFDEIISNIPADIEIVLKESSDFKALLIFAVTKAALNAVLTAESKAIDEQLICWIIYPKAKSKIAGDLNLMQSWSDLKNYGLTPCASAAIDEIWTAIRIKPLSTTKKSGLGNTEIKSSDYGEFINVDQKIITLPPDVKTELIKHPSALANFEKLSYTNKKEYVLWVLSAKQEKTKLSRLEKMVELLLNGKKNPNDK